MIPVLLSAAAVGATFACGEQRSAESTAEDLLVREPLLGDGFDTNRQELLGRCLRGNMVRAGTGRSSVTFESSLSEREVASLLDVSAKTRVKAGPATYSAEVKFVEASKSDSRSVSVVYASVYDFQSARLDEPELTSVANRAIDAGQFLAACGHEYVDQLNYSAKLMLLIRLNFDSEAASSEFSARVGAKFPVGRVSAAIQKAKEENTKAFSVEVKAIQLGGDISQLSAVFSGSNVSQETGQQNVLATIRCSGGEFDECERTITTAIDYATNVNREHSFPSQLRADNTGMTTAYMTKPWATAGVFPPSPIFSEALNSSRDELESMFEQNIKRRARLTAVQSARQGSDRMTRVEEEIEKTRQVEDRIIRATRQCYEQISPLASGAADTDSTVIRCLDAVADVRAFVQAEQFDDTVLEVSSPPPPGPTSPSVPDLLLRHASNDCPSGHARVAWLGALHAAADGYNFIDGPQNWALCSRVEGGMPLVILKHETNDCPAPYGRVAWLGALHAGADGIGFDRGPQNWALCSLWREGQPVGMLKHASNDCESGYARVAWLGALHAGADGYNYSHGPQNWALCSK